MVVKSKEKNVKQSEICCTPPHITELVVKVLGQIDLDPCADDGECVSAQTYYKAADNGLIQEWHGSIFLNPPHSSSGVWMAKLLFEFAAGRVKQAIALVPAATDTDWLSPVLKVQPVCFWKGRINFPNEDDILKAESAYQSHVLVYWGDNPQRFKEVFELYGVVFLPLQRFGDNNHLSELLGDREEKSFPHSPSNFLGDTEDSSSKNSLSPRKKRQPGDGNGCINWRTINKNGKEYPQAYYHWKEGNKKRSKYIPKKLLGLVTEANTAKRPVIEILELLGVGVRLNNSIWDTENSSDNRTHVDIEDKQNKFLGDTRLNNDETNILQVFEGSPSNNPSNCTSPRKRNKGKGSGSIHWRINTKKGKDYYEV